MTPKEAAARILADAEAAHADLAISTDYDGVKLALGIGDDNTVLTATAYFPAGNVNAYRAAEATCRRVLAHLRVTGWAWIGGKGGLDAGYISMIKSGGNKWVLNALAKAGVAIEGEQG